MRRAATILCLGFALVSGHASAALLEFDLVWTGVNTPASAVGSIAVDDSLLPNPGSLFLVPASELGIVAFSITVDGARRGNGTFDLSDFSAFSWSTGGSALDLSRELVGQPTTNPLTNAPLPWGTSALGAGAPDFNVQGIGDAPTLNGRFFIVLPRVGSILEILQLTSFAPRPAAVIPEPTSAVLFCAGIASVLARLRWRRGSL